MSISSLSNTRNFLARLCAPLKVRWQVWLHRRLPRARAIVLKQKRLFIFASPAGWLFLVALLIMLLTAINYQNNMSYGLTFWLAMMANVAVLHTNANLLGLKFSAVHATSVFPGQQAEFVIRVTAAPTRRHNAIKLVWPGADVAIDIPAGESVDVSLFQAVGARGWFQPPRLLVQSTWPVGLLRCWTYVDLDFQALVYPKPLPVTAQPPEDAEGGVVGFSDTQGHDDLMGFRDYRFGDSLRFVDWRSYAKGQDLQTRLHSRPVQQDHWLDWAHFNGVDTELRLSRLCFLALQYDARGDDYGLRLPGLEIAMASGDRHREAVLRALATYGIAEHSQAGEIAARADGPDSRSYSPDSRHALLGENRGERR